MKLWLWLSQQLTHAAAYCEQRSGVQPQLGKRICSACKKKIGRHDHWRFASRGPQHWNCNFPTKVLPAYLHEMVTEIKP